MDPAERILNWGKAKAIDDEILGFNMLFAAVDHVEGNAMTNLGFRVPVTAEVDATTNLELVDPIVKTGNEEVDLNDLTEERVKWTDIKILFGSDCKKHLLLPMTQFVKDILPNL